MLRLFGWVRPVLRWLFAVEALVLFLNAVSFLSRPFRSHLLSAPPRMWGFHVAVFAVSLVFAAAWWTTRSQPARLRGFAIAACLINIGEAVVLLYFDRNFQMGLMGFNLVLLSVSLLGIAAFSISQPADTIAVSRKARPIAGDRTHPWFDKTSWAVFYIALWFGTGGLDMQRRPPKERCGDEVAERTCDEHADVVPRFPRARSRVHPLLPSIIRIKLLGAANP